MHTKPCRRRELIQRRQRQEDFARRLKQREIDEEAALAKQLAAIQVHRTNH